ncbi:E3 ubiquitin-protein ligase mib2-like [Plakobranchus ocellatus]|uniref:E3 ubiquitin-protein ligase mib2-like n=1 Tax=Plakobranchus ocellatus TaxID=259542 RepID=A0AAV4CVS9_9GAST|nr:E3 ubiquitin-protein ligase mib2-like [Plakobranchus ocellatus]
MAAESYPPISLTSVISKIMERMVNVWLYHYREQSACLDESQSGLRAHRTTIYPKCHKRKASEIPYGSCLCRSGESLQSRVAYRFASVASGALYYRPYVRMAQSHSSVPESRDPVPYSASSGWASTGKCP